ncbi:aldehyde dehydrogenase family protein [Gordonia sinesedis]
MTTTEAMFGTEVDELRAVFATGRTRSYDWRVAQLRGIERLCLHEEAAIGEALAADLGRNALDTYLGDIAVTVTEAKDARKHLRSWMRKVRVRTPFGQLPARAWYQYEPLGVALIIGPWNYPVGLVLGPLVAAVAAGNCAVIKPSEVAPATSALVAHLVPKYLDATAIRVVEGGADTTQRLLAQGFDHAFFTGGTEVGRKIMAAAATTLTPVTLELGGKSPVIVLRDADIDVTARRLAWVKLLNSGQTCIAPDYVLADSTIVDALTTAIGGYLAEFRSGVIDPALPIVNDKQYHRIVDLIDSSSGRIVFGGAHNDGARRIEATVIADPGVDDAVMTEEIFGPILPIRSFDHLDEAVGFVNSRPKPLGLYVFSADRREAARVVDRMTSGGAVINHVAMHYTVPRLPFGGVGQSGIGAYHGQWGFQTFSHRRAVLSKRLRPDPTFCYPPQSGLASRILRKVF